MDLMNLEVFSNINDSVILQQFCRKVLFYVKILSSCELVWRFSNTTLALRKSPRISAWLSCLSVNKEWIIHVMIFFFFFCPFQSQS